MRIVSGTCKGRIINPPKQLKARPTTDFAKENFFNVLNNRIEIEELTVLDLFSGSGSISYEFASRGAKKVVSIEKDSVHQSFIRGCARTLGLDAIISIRSDVFVYLKTCKDSFDMIFADPPYDLDKVDLLPDLVMGSSILSKEGLFVLEHSKSKDFSTHPNFVDHRSYGSVNFSFFEHK